MRFQNGFRARSALMAGLALARTVRFWAVACPRADTCGSARRVRRVPSAGSASTMRWRWRSSRTSTCRSSGINPQIQDTDIAQVKTGYAPTVPRQHQLQRPDPAAGELAVRQHQPDRRQQRSSFDFGVRRSTSGGGNYNVVFNNTRATTNNIFTNFDPQLDVEHQRELHPAAAAQLQDGRHAPAAAGQPEEPRDLRRRSCSSRSR